MNELLSKLSSYNLFNYLLPGIIFVVLSSEMTSHNLIQSNLLLGMFLYYFIGLVISRFGSLVVEPLLKWIGFLKFADYKNFVLVSKKDKKLELLSEVNNSYRTLCSLFALLLLLRVYEYFESTFPPLREWNSIILIILLIIMFLLSYRKQTTYVRKRIEVQGE